MTIGGISIILISGSINFILLLFQLASGLRWIKVPFPLHRRIGIILIIVATVHGLLSLFVI